MKKILIVVSLFCSLYCSAQQNTNVTTDPKTIKLFFEKSYLHTDRSFYGTGETLWYAAYLVNGKSTSLTQTSNNLYVELLSPNSKVLDRKMIRLDQGFGHGDLKLNDSLSTGWYQLRAYTNWMRNFGDDFIFYKKIYIRNTAGQSSGSPRTSPPNSKMIAFFPEGGSLVDGLNSIVAFKANDNLGDGVVVNASIVSAKGDTITSFKSTEAGLGIFAFTPQTGEKYSVVGRFGAENFKTELPSILTKGLSLHATVDSVSIKASISANQPMFSELQNKPLTVIIKHAGEVIYSGNITLTRPMASITLPTKDFPQGVAVLTVLDHQGRPSCERLIYIQSPNKINLTIVPDKSEYNAREKVSLKIKATDIQGSPINTFLSLAAVDALIPDDGNNIVSYLLLQSEIKGEIKSASQYFDPKNPSRLKQLDLLLLTQGWREYVWKRLADSAVKISYLPEPGITVKGLVREKLVDNPMPDMNITLFGSAFTGDKIFLAKTDRSGRYYLDGLKWFGEQAVKISSQDGKAKKGGWLQIDTSYKELPFGQRYFAQQSASTSLLNEMERRMAYNRKLEGDKEIELNEVKVVGAKRERVELFGKTLTTFGYPDQVFNITAADHTFKGLEHFLLTKVNGAFPVEPTAVDTTGETSDTDEGITFIANGQKVRPRVLINNREDLQQRLDYYSLTMDQVNQVVVRHLVDNEGQDVYLLKLDLKDTALRGPNLHLLNLNLNGYYEAKTFYSPNYASTPSTSSMTKDLRTTIFWSPLVKTNAAGEASVTYYNGDNKATILIKAEGISENGAVITSKVSYQVK